MTIGNFDGVHLGHQQLLTRFKQRCAAKDLVPAVFTFRPHPELYFNPQKNHLLTRYERKLKIIQGLGLENLVEVAFDENIRKLTGEDFAKEWLFARQGLKMLWAGHDFTFGRDKEDPAAVLARQKRDVEFKKIQAFKLDGEVVSSSLIRNALLEGSIEKANRLLGRRYSLLANVVHGKKLGRELGFPTLNLDLDYPALIPGEGVYAISCLLDGKSFQGAMNVGKNPSTDQSGGIKLEAHLFDFNEKAYGKDVEIFFESFIRDEKKFESLEQLKAQIASDVLKIKERLN